MTPRLWLILWSALGAALLVYVMIAASVQPAGGRPGAEARASAPLKDPRLLVGDMSDFAYAFPARSAPAETFLHEGRMVSLADFRGKAVLVNFWATWCAPCLRELPSLDALQRDLGGDAFQVVAVAADPRGPEAAQDYLDRLEIRHLDLYADPNLRFASAVGGSSVLPLSILYDADGAEVGRLLGEADWSSPEARALVSRALASRNEGR